MQVKCIDVHTPRTDGAAGGPTGITEGKIYEVHLIRDTVYEILNDDNKYANYSKFRFEEYIFNEESESINLSMLIEMMGQPLINIVGRHGHFEAKMTKARELPNEHDGYLVTLCDDGSLSHPSPGVGESMDDAVSDYLSNIQGKAIIIKNHDREMIKMHLPKRIRNDLNG